MATTLHSDDTLWARAMVALTACTRKLLTWLNAIVRDAVVSLSQLDD